MTFDTASITLMAITLFAAIVNGALGYGFSSLTVPVALLFYANRVLNPTMVIVEVAINLFVLFMNLDSLPKVYKRVYPIVIGLVPGVYFGSQLLATLHPSWIKFFTYLIPAAADLRPGGGDPAADSGRATDRFAVRRGHRVSVLRHDHLRPPAGRDVQQSGPGQEGLPRGPRPHPRGRVGHDRHSPTTTSGCSTNRAGRSCLSSCRACWSGFRSGRCSFAACTPRRSAASV